jgi:drug/metabolite transporter (DMT)-like permease
MTDGLAWPLTLPLMWLVAALLSSVLTAQNVEMNRRAGQEGFRLNLWRTGLSALFWLPLALLVPWPDDAWFYATAIFAGLGLIVGFTIQNDLAVKHNGRVAILHMPLKAVLVFALWLLLHEPARAHLLAEPLTKFGILACLGVMVWALTHFRRHDVSWESLKAVLPIVVLYGIGDVFTRMAIPPELLGERLLIFLFVMTTSSALGSLLLLPWRPKKHLPLMSQKLVRSAGWAAFGSTLNQVLFFMALVLGPSPAYVSMVLLLAPVWLLIYHRWANIPDDASPWAGTVMVGAAVVLMFLAA